MCLLLIHISQGNIYVSQFFGVFLLTSTSNLCMPPPPPPTQYWWREVIGAFFPALTVKLHSGWTTKSNFISIHYGRKGKTVTTLAFWDPFSGSPLGTLVTKYINGRVVALRLPERLYQLQWAMLPYPVYRFLWECIHYSDTNQGSGTSDESPGHILHLWWYQFDSLIRSSGRRYAIRNTQYAIRNTQYAIRNTQ